MSNLVPQSRYLATVLDYHRSEIESLHCVADRLVDGWSLASVSRLPSGAYLTRFNRPRKSAPFAVAQSGPAVHAPGELLRRATFEIPSGDPHPDDATQLVSGATDFRGEARK